jgi:hypothetical protein
MRLERRSRWVREWTACLLTIHELLLLERVSGGLSLLVWSKPHALGLLLWKLSVAGGLGHDAVWSLIEAAIACGLGHHSLLLLELPLLIEILKALARRCDLGMHLRLPRVSSQLGLEGWHSKTTLLIWILWCGRCPRRRSDQSILRLHLLWRLWPLPRRGGRLLLIWLEWSSGELIEERGCRSSRLLWLLHRCRGLLLDVGLGRYRRLQWRRREG